MGDRRSNKRSLNVDEINEALFCKDLDDNLIWALKKTLMLKIIPQFIPMLSFLKKLLSMVRITRLKIPLGSPKLDRDD